MLSCGTLGILLGSNILNENIPHGWHFPFLFVYSVGRKSRQHKGFWLVIKKGIASCVASPGFLSFLFLFVTILHLIQILSSPKTLLYISFAFFQSWIGNFLFCLFSFAFFRSLIGNFLFLFLSFDLWSGISFSFCFLPIFDWNFFLLLKRTCNLKTNGSFFLGDPSVPSSEGKGRNSYPRSRFMADELRFWLNKLVEGRAWCMSGMFVWQAI